MSLDKRIALPELRDGLGWNGAEAYLQLSAVLCYACWS
jgi:hypothetical protein